MTSTTIDFTDLHANVVAREEFLPGPIIPFSPSAELSKISYGESYAIIKYTACLRKSKS